MSITRLVPRPRADIPIDRMWLVFFGEAEGAPWWGRFLAPGFRHVVACAWFAEQERWVYYNPTRRGTVVLIYRDDEFGPRLSQLIADSSVVLRVASNHQRGTTPLGWWCVGAIKALLGVRGRALSPRSLCRYLQRNGATIISNSPVPEGTCSKKAAVG